METLSVDPIFVDLARFFNTSLLSLWALNQEPFLLAVEKEDKVPLETSFGGASYIFPKRSVEDVRRDSNGSEKGPFHTDLIRQLARITCIASFNILEADERYPLVKDTSVIQFFRHIRNGSAHNNHFKFNQYTKDLLDESDYSPEFRGKTITRVLEGKEVFFGFMAVGDIPFLLNDVSKAIKITT